MMSCGARGWLKLNSALTPVSVLFCCCRLDDEPIHLHAHGATKMARREG